MSDPSEVSVTWPQALAWRMGRHLLDPVGRGTAQDAVARLGAVPAMDETLAELAVRTRCASPGTGTLEAAVRDGSVIKAFAFRGAVHYLAPEDGGIYLALRCAARQWELPSWVEYYRLAPGDWPEFRAAVREALSGGPLTVAELGEVLTSRRAYRHLRPVFDEGAGTLIKPLTWQGDMSIGPTRDGRLTFRRLGDNPRWQGVPELEEAGPRAISAYLRCYGPATPGHLHYWLGQGLSAGKRRIDGWFVDLQDRLVAVDAEGTTAYVVREDVDDLLAAEPSDEVRLLPGHDQWVMGAGTKDEHVVPPAHRTPVTRKANLVVVGGVVRGTWRRTGDEVVITWLGDAPAPVTAIEREVTRLGDLLDLPLVPRVK